MAIFDFDGHESIGTDNKDFTGRWRYIEGLPFYAVKLQNAVVSFEKYLVVVGEDQQKDKVVFYFDVEAEKWFNKDGEISPTSYQPSTSSLSILYNYIFISFMTKILAFINIIHIYLFELLYTFSH